MPEELTLRPFFWRATRLFPETEVVSRTHDGIDRYTYLDFGDRVRRLAAALANMGVTSGDRVGTLGWNTHRHLEAYYAVPLSGAQLHTVNLLLRDDNVEYIINDAADDVLIVDRDAVTILDRLWDQIDGVREVVVMDDIVPETDADLPLSAFEDLIADTDPMASWPPLSEDDPAGMCYTSGTTGMPKGVEYTHKMLYAHAMMVMTPAALNIAEDDVVMPVVPMFHVNSWEFPYAVTMAGAKQVYPGPSPDPADLVDLIESEDVTLTAGVPTVWIDVLGHLDEHGGDLSSLERIIVGGSAAPREVMRRYEDEYDVTIEHAWGMTEVMSIGSVSRPTSGAATGGREAALDKRAKQGLLSPGLEMRVVGDDGEPVSWDGEAFGELLVRGPTVVGEYYNRPEANESDFVAADDGGTRWLRTGDIATVDEDGYIEVVDRAKDVIKSGGEWISSIELENALMAHDDIAEAVVIAAPHERWQERPLAFVVPKAGCEIGVEAVRTFLAKEFPRWWLPDGVRFREEIPKTATGKFDKKTLRETIEEPDLPYAPGDGGGK
ncbi:MAG: fatty-acyl-CoA synthase [Natronomonas sp.]|jgi:fatty-acyl-CoA synthase